MKQLIQDFKSGAIQLVNVPPPAGGAGLVVVRNAFSLVSAGTEKATVTLGQQSLVGKARSRPDLVKQVLATVKREGLAATVRKVQSRLDSWKALGYATAGTVVEVGAGVTGFSVGDRVACAGQDYASHAEVVAVPQNLCVKLPEAVAFEHAAFATLGAIALQGVRQADVRLGEVVAVIGLGLVGQLTAQILQAAGCRVLGIDVNPAACDLARRCGCEATGVSGQDDLERIAAGLTTGFGVDAVIITASAPTNQPVELAGKLCRERGRVVMVGVTGMEVPRDVYYRKELEFRLSRSYGPGRYDPLYEERGVDYPVGYVRWTEGRNLEAFVQLLAGRQVNVAPLITHTLPVDEAVKAYELITGKRDERVVGVLIAYPEDENWKEGRRDAWRPGSLRSGATDPGLSSGSQPPSTVVLGVIGAGHYAQGVLLPQFKANQNVRLHTVCTAQGINATKAQAKFGFAAATTDWRAVVADPEVNTLLVATRHDLHAAVVIEALRAGKAVFCEKPLCLRADQLDEIEQVIQRTGHSRLMVGFNRRFAPFAAAVRKLAGPRVMRYRVSVAPLPLQHWVNDREIGGGRILGEVCHFVDFLQFAAGQRPVTVFAQGFGTDNVQVAVRFGDGSVGAIDYFSVADPALAKEQFEIFGGGRHLVVDDFRDKGQAEEVRQFVAAVTAGGPMPIPLAEILASTRATFAIETALGTSAAVTL